VCIFSVNGEGASEEEEEMEEEEAEEMEEDTKDALVEEILQQGDTAVIYPEAPEECSTLDRGGADENGTSICSLTSSFYIYFILLYTDHSYNIRIYIKTHLKMSDAIKMFFQAMELCYNVFIALWMKDGTGTWYCPTLEPVALNQWH